MIAIKQKQIIMLELNSPGVVGTITVVDVSGAIVVAENRNERYNQSRRIKCKHLFHSINQQSTHLLEYIDSNFHHHVGQETQSENFAKV